MNGEIVARETYLCEASSMGTELSFVFCRYKICNNYTVRLEPIGNSLHW